MLSKYTNFRESILKVYGRLVFDKIFNNCVYTFLGVFSIYSLNTIITDHNQQHKVSIKGKNHEDTHRYYSSEQRLVTAI